MIKSKSFTQNLTSGIQQRLKKIFFNPFAKVNINWLTLKYLKHLPNNQKHYHYLFKSKTWFYNGQEYLYGIKEIFIDEIYKQSLPPECNILDCGAHIGLSVIYLSSICPSARIVAFEPDEKNFALLQKNMISHQLKTVVLKNEAVWTEDTELRFTSEGNMSSRIVSDNTGTITVKATRLKNYLNKHIHFLKLDIEGAEYPVIKDIASDLQNVNKMFIEYHGNFNQNNELLDILNIVENADFLFYIKEATPVYKHPFSIDGSRKQFDVQLNIFCFRADKRW